jgi:hypothetical protein
MKKLKLGMLLAVVFFCFVSSAFAEIGEERITKLEKIGFPKEEAAIPLAELVEKGVFSGEMDILKGMFVSAIIRKDVAEENIYLNWTGDYSFQKKERKAKRYEKNGFVVYRFVNLGDEIFFRIGDLPKPIQEAVVPVALPDPPKEEKKAEAPKETLLPIQKVEEVYEASALPLDLKNLGMEEEVKIPVATISSEKKQLAAVQDVYEALVLPLDLKKLENLKATVIEFDINGTWNGDAAGFYPVYGEDGKEVIQFLSREVWRTIIADPIGEYEIYPAVISEETCFITHVVCPGKSKLDLTNKQAFLISGSGKFVLTTSGKIIEFDFEKFQEDKDYKTNFLKKNESWIQSEKLLDISPNSEFGTMYISTLKERFPRNYYISGKLVSADVDIETLKKLVGESNNASYIDRVIKNSGLPIVSVAMIVFAPVAIPLELGRVTYGLLAAAWDKSLSKGFGESTVSGFIWGARMDKCLLKKQKRGGTS